ncbi:beta-galactosidase [Nonomuraea sp. ZG12]|uniref:beta-galactosidase n=1 Tax=Nonomuraea sp. ZG12 TaxID=3452207 RepID=UPI003F8A465B
MTNFMRFYRNADYWSWAPEQDAVALDIYPDPADPDAHVSAAFQYDLFRSLKGGQPWMLMEQAASAVSQWKLNVVKEPGRMRLGSLQALARAADSVMFFQWRAGRGGHERFHSAMLPHSGPGSRTFREIVDLGREVKLLSPVAGTRMRADIAVLFDWTGGRGWRRRSGCPATTSATSTRSCGTTRRCGASTTRSTWCPPAATWPRTRCWWCRTRT